MDVVNKTLAFHTSVNYEILAPPPFSADVHENLLADLARISQQDYASDFDLHIDMSQTLKRLNDGHCVYINSCYDCTSPNNSYQFLPDMSRKYNISALLNVLAHPGCPADGLRRFTERPHRSRGLCCRFRRIRRRARRLAERSTWGTEGQARRKFQCSTWFSK